MLETSLLSKKELVELLRDDKEFREAFALEYVKNSIPTQLRALRKEREWSQAELGENTKKPRNVITRLENPNSNIPNLNTMVEIAWGCGAALVVKVIPFSELLKEYDQPFEAMYAPSIDSNAEIAKLEAWANQIDENFDEEDESEIENANPTVTGIDFQKPINASTSEHSGRNGLRLAPTPINNTAIETAQNSEVETANSTIGSGYILLAA